MVRCVAVLVLGMLVFRGEGAGVRGQELGEPGALATGVSLHSAERASGASAKRGFELLTTKAFVPPIWFQTGYDNAWKQWGLKEKPADYAAALMDRYGLHSAP